MTDFRACPQCRSSDVCEFIGFAGVTGDRDGGLDTAVFHCPSCNIDFDSVIRWRAELIYKKVRE